jgi:hypothetical protein
VVYCKLLNPSQVEIAGSIGLGVDNGPVGIENRNQFEVDDSDRCTACAISVEDRPVDVKKSEVLVLCGHVVVHLYGQRVCSSSSIDSHIIKARAGVIGDIVVPRSCVDADDVVALTSIHADYVISVTGSNGYRVISQSAAGETVWKYINPVINTGPLSATGAVPPDPNKAGECLNEVFKVRRYSPDYPGLKGRDLTPGGPIEGPMPSPVQEFPSGLVPLVAGVGMLSALLLERSFRAKSNI